MRYTWDEKKNRGNIALHGVAFEDAVRIFEGPTVEKIDDRIDYGEIRVYAIGLVNGMEITVVYTDRDNDERRIISAWRSEAHERRAYWRYVASWARDRHKLAPLARNKRCRNTPGHRV